MYWAAANRFQSELQVGHIYLFNIYHAESAFPTEYAVRQDSSGTESALA